MDDRCTITADRAGVRDDELDEDTGRLIRNTDASTVYEGKCLVTPVTDQDGTPEPDETTGAVDRGPRYRLLLPVDANPVGRGMRLKVTASLRDPELLTAEFGIDAPGQVSTYAVARVIGLERL